MSPTSQTALLSPKDLDGGEENGRVEGLPEQKKELEGIV